MNRLCLMLALACCTPPSTPLPDAGPPDAGPMVQQFCLGSSCSAAGTWRVVFTGSATNPVCQPVDDQIQLTSDGGTVCMLRATDGGSDGGCGMQFVIAWSQAAGDSGTLDGTDVWSVDIPDAGHMYGSWTTHVTGATGCDATYSVHAVR